MDLERYTILMYVICTETGEYLSGFFFYMELLQRVTIIRIERS